MLELSNSCHLIHRAAHIDLLNRIRRKIYIHLINLDVKSRVRFIFILYSVLYERVEDTISRLF